MKNNKETYQARDVIQLDRQGKYYCKHLSAMTEYKLEKKSDIAAELAYRDFKIDRLKRQLQNIVDNDSVLMPVRLAAENGGKHFFIGEFTESINIPCCCGGNDPDCNFCKGSGYYKSTIPISWSTIKEIYKKAVKHFGKTI